MTKKPGQLSSGFFMACCEKILQACYREERSDVAISWRSKEAISGVIARSAATWRSRGDLKKPSQVSSPGAQRRGDLVAI